MALVSAITIATRAATTTVTNKNDNGPGSSSFTRDYSGIASVSTAGVTPTPTATPCPSVGSWIEQASHPIAVSGQAVASVGDNIYSFGGIAGNTAIANAYKYTPATNTCTPIASLPAPRGWFSGASDGTYVYC